MKTELFGYTETFTAVFLLKIFLFKWGIRKDVAVSVNKESMNKSSSKSISDFIFSLSNTFIVAAYRDILRTQSNIYNGAFLRK